jgi:hypothetical protein
MSLEVPFTRKDVLALLSGTADEETRPANKIRQALAAVIKHVEVLEGLVITEAQLESIFTHNEGDFWFWVPNYFCDAWRSCFESGEKCRIHRLRIEPWKREFIEAHYEMSRLIPALKRLGAKSVGEVAEQKS